MEIRKMIRTLALFLALSSATLATPIAVTDTTGKVLLGVDGIDVGGVLYDARFVDGSFEDIFTLTTGTLPNGYPNTTYFYDFPSTDGSSAISASTALMSALDLFPEWDLRQDGYSILGVGGRGYWRLMTPFKGVPNVYAPSSVYAAGVAESATTDSILTGTIYPYDPNVAATNTDFQYSNMDVWVDWSVSPVPAPAPGSLWLFLFGVGLLGYFSKQKEG